MELQALYRPVAARKHARGPEPPRTRGGEGARRVRASGATAASFAASVALWPGRGRSAPGPGSRAQGTDVRVCRRVSVAGLGRAGKPLQRDVSRLIANGAYAHWRRRGGSCSAPGTMRPQQHRGRERAQMARAPCIALYTYLKSRVVSMALYKRRASRDAGCCESP